MKGVEMGWAQRIVNSERGQLKSTLPGSPNMHIVFRGPAGETGRLVFAADEPTRFEGNPQASERVFRDMFGKSLDEYIDERVEALEDSRS